MKWSRPAGIAFPDTDSLRNEIIASQFMPSIEIKWYAPLSINQMSCKVLMHHCMWDAYIETVQGRIYMALPPIVQVSIAAVL